MELSFTTVSTAVLLVVLIALYIKLNIKSRQHLVEKPDSNVFVPRPYTLAELSQYDGKQKPFAFVGVKGIIYNVDLQWYGPDAPYNAFASCDCSRQLGKVVVGRTEINADWTRLSPSHLQNLNEWEERLRSKYSAVGWISDPFSDFLGRAKSLEP